ncbi:M18 family aminopeptidase [Marinilabiliaceae bacterium ANBcel2]|nr:M18 family aminopeptidase [Marinilabiliaceae bacterium ANBcel2]
MKYRNNAQNLIDFIYKGVTPFHVVEEVKSSLKESGFKELQLNESWNLQKGEKYFTTRNDSSLFAFITGTESPAKHGCKIISAHSDSPSFKIKPDAAIGVNNYYIKFNTETYGGAILSSWFDRPLSMAGRVTMESNNPLNLDKRLVNFKKPLLIIPNLAIHLNRSVNEGVAIDKQKDLLPLAAIDTDATTSKENYLHQLIAKELNVDANKILSYDLTLYEYNKGTTMGVNDEFISSPRLDNLAMVHAGLSALKSAKADRSTQILAIFDNEEVGSLTKQGADSPLFKNIFSRIVKSYSSDDESFYQSVYNSFMISADMAHSIHPNYQEKHDPVLQPVINGGPVIKITANQKYTTDSESAAIFMALCKKAKVPVQQFVNRSDMAGGSTLGNVLTGQIDIKSVDIGNAMLAMHSVRELSGVKDHTYLIEVFKEFFCQTK